MNEEEIFQVAAEMPAAERAAYLATACEGQPALRERVERLLASHDDGGFMQRSADCTHSAELKDELARLKPEEGEDRIGNYKLLQKIGEGGFGTVWMAEQLEPVRRRVALKIIKPGMDTKEVIVRFEQERQALALMDHPNIAKVLDAGVTPLGRPFFVMELVRGIRITDFCDQNNLSTPERLNLFIAVCNAIQHAHQKGIIHRDIKPSNILVTLHDGVPVPKVIDFGVAKAIQSQRLTDLTFFTRFEQMIGTPLYMSPEQAEMSGLDIDTRSDIYSLGVLLYELLTGTTPFDAKELMASGIDAMRKTIRETEPVRPSTKLSQTLVAANVSSLKSPAAGKPEEEVRADSRRLLRVKETITLLKGDLDWIVMKCLEKDRTRRYETANGLAADLKRHLSNEAVVARPPTPLYRFQKMVRRNKLAFAAAGAVMAALLVGLFLASWQALRANNAEHTTRRNAYAAEINVAFHALAENNLGRARELLDRQRPKPGEEDLRGFEWRYLWRLCQGDEFKTFRDEGAKAAAFSPDGKLFVYSGSKIIVREVASRKVVVTLPVSAETLSFAPHANLLASGNSSGVKLWDTETWREARSLPDTMLPSLFSPDGRWLVTGVAGGLRVWDTQTWQPVGDCPGEPRLASRAWNAVAVSPDGQFLLTVAGEDEAGDHLRVWRLPSMERLPDVRIENQQPFSAAFSADGKHILVGLWNGQLAVVDFATRQVRPTSKEHSARVTAIAVATNGLTFVTSSADRTVNLWDATTFKHLARLRGHLSVVWCVAISPDGRLVVSGSTEGRHLMPVTKLWNASTRHMEPVLEGSGLVAGSFDDGRRLVAATSNGWCVWTPESGARVDLPIPTSPPLLPLGKPYDVKPDEPLGTLGRSDGSIEIWHLTTGALVTAWPTHHHGVSVVTFSPDGKRLATGTTNGEVKIWDFASQRETGRFGPVGCLLLCLAFSPDGNTLAASGQSSFIWLWDLGTRREMRLEGQGNHVASVAFSPDGKLLATTTFLANEARLWELPSGKELAPLKGHVSGVSAVAFSPDGKTLATGGFDNKVKLWNVSTHQELVTLSLDGLYPTLRFSPDGRTLVLGNLAGVNRRIQILRAPSFEDIAAADRP